jgi:hypothetical protein
LLVLVVLHLEMPLPLEVMVIHHQALDILQAVAAVAAQDTLLVQQLVEMV